MKEKYIYIYNPKQAKFFINKGLKVLSINQGKYGDTYVKFKRDAKCEEVFTMWVDNKQNI